MEEDIKTINDKFYGKEKDILLDSLNRFYRLKNISIEYKKYNVGDSVFLTKNTLLHGTYKNLEGLKEITKSGLLSSIKTESRTSKYPCSVCVWNLKKDYLLKDYIDFYSGGTIVCFNHSNNESMSEVIPFSQMPNLMNKIVNNGFLTWKMEQTKEARFLPSLVQNKSQIGIIFTYNSEILHGDILNPNIINDEDVKYFVHPDYYDKFIIDRKNKDDFFTDRESAILYGIPSNFIEGILVGRQYEHDETILNEIKALLPKCYICNLDGIVIRN